MMKNLKVMVMFLLMMVVVPMCVNAQSIKLSNTCDDLGNQDKCQMMLELTNASEKEFTFVFTPQGGATITENDIVLDSSAELDWEISKKTTLTSGAIEVTVKRADDTAADWNQNLLEYTYTESGHEDCKVVYALKSNEQTTTPEPTPEKNPQTGSTLPYIALGGIVLAATGAYLATRNKSKMYKI